MARQVAVPPAARELGTLARIDYEDAFVVPIGPTPGRTGEDLARSLLEDAPAATRWALRGSWRALGLRSAPAASGRPVLGWEVWRATPDAVLLGAGSLVGLPAEVLVLRDGEQLLVATFVRFTNPLARALWASVAPGHRRAVRMLLEEAASRERRRPSG